MTDANSSRPLAVVTGANSGIGKEITRGLMKQGWHVVMACRNMEACEQVRASLVAEGGPGSCSCSRADLEDLESLRAFAKEQRSALQASSKDGEQRQIKVLVNNAGIMGPVAESPSGLDRHLAANHYGPFLLTRLLLPMMGPGSRIVNVSSMAHLSGAMHFDQAGELDQHPSSWAPKYARSKLANVAFTFELQKRLQGRGITAYSTSPGFVKTPLYDTFPWYLQWAIKPLSALFFRTPEQGAQSSIYAATSPELEGRNVLFIHNDKPHKHSALADDPELTEKLWLASERYVGLTEAEKALE